MAALRLCPLLKQWLGFLNTDLLRVTPTIRLASSDPHNLANVFLFLRHLYQDDAYVHVPISYYFSLVCMVKKNIQIASLSSCSQRMAGIADV